MTINSVEASPQRTERLRRRAVFLAELDGARRLRARISPRRARALRIRAALRRTIAPAA